MNSAHFFAKQQKAMCVLQDGLLDMIYELEHIEWRTPTQEGVLKKLTGLYSKVDLIMFDERDEEVAPE